MKGRSFNDSFGWILAAFLGATLVGGASTGGRPDASASRTVSTPVSPVSTDVRAPQTADVESAFPSTTTAETFETFVRRGNARRTSQTAARRAFGPRGFGRASISPKLAVERVASDNGESAFVRFRSAWSCRSSTRPIFLVLRVLRN